MNALSLRRLSAAALDFCLPRRCLLCREALEGDGPLCPRCEMTLPVTEEQAVQTGTPFDRCLSPVYYSGALRESFHRYKFGGHWHYSAIYARWMWECVRQWERDPFDLVTWVPVSLPRRLRRGYDQALRLARDLSRLGGLPLEGTLDKYRHNAEQSGTRSAEERRKNTRNVYRLRRGAEVTGKRVLLVDDIITTGSTLEEASRVLREAGAAEIVCVTLARTPREG
jgi:ComF family protein